MAVAYGTNNLVKTSSNLRQRQSLHLLTPVREECIE